MSRANNSLSESWTVEPVGRVAAPLREQVVAALRKAILDFHLKPGQRLVERELMEQLGVSRTTIREALRELTSEGLVTDVPQRGAVVATPTLEDAIDLYEVRAVLESLVVQRFVARASDDQVARLAAAVDAFEAAIGRGADIREVLATKGQFYEVLIEGAASTALRQMLEGIQARVQILRATSLSERGRAPEAIRELRAIADAVKARDSELAAQRATEHIRNASATALVHMRSGQATREPA
ncbi:MAG TPA: GntR family transcriptional regulator [Candidatus Limnocylindrales bacterium]|nr:GntR family transcriptional regulator [Candidatus Limnocylindrales bacterium]